MDNIIISNRKELEELIREVVAREVKKQLAAIKQPPAKKEKLVSVKQLCEELNISRQTVNNWRKSQKTDYLIKPFITKMGGKVLYDIAAIRQVIKEYEIFFGGNRDYDYKYEAIASDETKKDNRFKHIRSLIMQAGAAELTEDDRLFYAEECKWRGERNRLL